MFFSYEVNSGGYTGYSGYNNISIKKRYRYILGLQDLRTV